MADLNDFLERLKQVKKALFDAMPDIVQDYAHEARVLAERKIIDSGFGEDYSTKEVPAFFLYGKELNKRGADAIKKKSKAKEGFNWAGLRQAQGLPTDHVTLAYSNEMWKGLNVVRVEKRGSSFIAYLGGNNKAQQDKLTWNFERYGDFINKGIDQSDREYLNGEANSKILKIIKNIL